MLSTFRVCRPVWYIYLPRLNWLVPSSCKLPQGYLVLALLCFPIACLWMSWAVTAIAAHFACFQCLLMFWEACCYWMAFWVTFCNFCSTWLLCWYAAGLHSATEGASHAPIGAVLLCCWPRCSCQVAIWSWSFWIAVWWCRQCFVLCCWLGQLPDWFAADCIVRCWGLINRLLVSACRLLLAGFYIFVQGAYSLFGCIYLIKGACSLCLLICTCLYIWPIGFQLCFTFWSIQFLIFDKKKKKDCIYSPICL